jgi:hypothetical protein
MITSGRFAAFSYATAARLKGGYGQCQLQRS